MRTLGNQKNAALAPRNGYSAVFVPRLEIGLLADVVLTVAAE